MGYLVSRTVSRQSRLGTLVFPGKTGCFAVEVVGFELDARCLETRGPCVQAETAYPLMRKLICSRASDIFRLISRRVRMVGYNLCSPQG
jgi:hypothetical protein